MIEENRISSFWSKLKKLQIVSLHTMLFVHQHMKEYSIKYLIFWILFSGIAFGTSRIMQHVEALEFILLIIFAGCFYHYGLRLILKFMTFILGKMWVVEVNQENKEFTIKKLTSFYQKLTTKTKKYFIIIFALYFVVIGSSSINNTKYNTQLDALIYTVSLSLIMGIVLIFGSMFLIKIILKRMPIMWGMEP